MASNRIPSIARTALALAATALLAGWHIAYALRAGPLWRDEAHLVNWAGLPSLAEVWSNRHLDAFPATWSLLVHAWMSVAGGSDASLRALGAVIGIAGLAAIWWTARQLGARAPLFALVLFAANPTTLVFGGSVRGYGLGLIALIVFLGAAARLVARLDWRNAVLAVLAALSAVHTDFRSGVFVFALLVAAAVVAARRRDARRAALLVALGAFPAISLLPYAASYPAVSQWMLYQQDSGRAELAGVFTGALATAGPWMEYLWGLALLLAVAACARELTASREARDPAAQDRALFLLVALAIAVFTDLVLLDFIGLTEIWYFLSLLAVLAWFADGALALRGEGTRWQTGAALALASCAIALETPTVWQSHGFRMTNVDAIAAQVDAAPDDLIVVGNHLVAPTFGRYYRGRAPWITLPDVADHRFQDPAAFREKMGRADPIRSELDRIAATLRAGHRVWWVGDPIIPRPGTAAPELPPTHAPDAAWPDLVRYSVAWSAQAGALLAREAREIRLVVPRSAGAVNPFEHTQLYVAEPRSDQG